mgnify:CR=1 FL=1
MKKNIITGVLLIILIILGIALYMYNKPHKDIAAAQIDYQLSLSVLFDEFSNNPEDASIKYSEKVIAIEGKMKNLEKNENAIQLFVVDDNGRLAICEMLEFDDTNFLEGNNVKVKGLFIGYDDDLLGPEIKFKKCTILE